MQTLGVCLQGDRQSNTSKHSLQLNSPGNNNDAARQRTRLTVSQGFHDDTMLPVKQQVSEARSRLGSSGQTTEKCVVSTSQQIRC